MLKTRIIQYIFTVGIFVSFLYAIDGVHAMNEGDVDYQNYLEARKAFDSITKKRSRRKRTALSRDYGIKIENALEKGAQKGNLNCQLELLVIYKNGLVSYDPPYPICKNKEKEQFWQERYDLNPNNPNYKINFDLMQKREQGEKEKTENIKLQLEVERAKIRIMELELQQKQSTNRPQENYQQQNNNNFERNLRVANAMINLTNDSANLYNNLQDSNFGGF